MSLLQQIESGVALRPKRMLIYGTRGIDASTPVASFPEPVFGTTDDGLQHIDGRRFPIAQQFGEVLAALRNLHSEPHGYRTVAIDPFNTLERLILGRLCRDRGVESIGIVRRVLHTTSPPLHTAKSCIGLPPVMLMDIRVLAPQIAVPKHSMSSLN